ncbi:MAG: cysteine--tRNA ligase [Nitrospirota bacterium]
MENKIYIYNSLTRKKEEFIPLQPKEIKMYVCGPTVYDQAHIGHARSAYIFDVIRRYLTYRGYKVKFVRNVTDVDDKIIDKAQKEFKAEDLNFAVKKVSSKYLDLYHEDMKSLGILDPDVEPKATEYVTKENPLMQKFISQLIDKGCAYVSGGDVYFNIKKAKNYGKLSNQEVDRMESGARIALGEKKKDPLDFVLWKAAKAGEPAWDSPWGKGRPGWHIECSVMSSDILGSEFDIHGGGIDLIFPHHENEIAQSEAAGNKFARYWIHHGLLTINGKKMAKSSGNFITVKGFLEEYKNANLLKLLFLSTHYLHPVDYTEEKIKEAKKQIYIFENFFLQVDALIKLWEYWSSKPELVALGKMRKGIFQQEEKEKIDVICAQFESSMDNDFNASQALSFLFELANYGSALVSMDKEEGFTYIESKLRLFLKLLGIEIERVSISETLLKKLVAIMISRRNKNFNELDREREEITCIYNLIACSTASSVSLGIIKRK